MKDRPEMADPADASWTPILTNIISGAVSAAVTGFFTVFTMRRKSHAEAKKAEVEASVTLDEVINKKLQALLDAQEKRIADLTTEIHALRTEVANLKRELEEKNKSIGLGI